MSEALRQQVRDRAGRRRTAPPCSLWQAAAMRWLREQAHKATHEGDKQILRWLDRHLANREVESINRALINAITEAKQADRCANATVNRTLALLRAILRKCARDWEWRDRTPSVRLLKEPTRRIRFLTHEQARKLPRELPPHLHDMALFTLSTGLRRANVTGLTWEQVDLSRKLDWIHPDQAKARKAIAVPLNETAMHVVRAQRGQTATGGGVVWSSACAASDALPRIAATAYETLELIICPASQASENHRSTAISTHPAPLLNGCVTPLLSFRLPAQFYAHPSWAHVLQSFGCGALGTPHHVEFAPGPGTRPLAIR